MTTYRITCDYSAFKSLDKYLDVDSWNIDLGYLTGGDPSDYDYIDEYVHDKLDDWVTKLDNNTVELLIYEYGFALGLKEYDNVYGLSRCNLDMNHPLIAVKQLLYVLIKNDCIQIKEEVEEVDYKKKYEDMKKLFDDCCIDLQNANIRYHELKQKYEPDVAEDEDN
jgi:hypothetical protein